MYEDDPNINHLKVKKYVLYTTMSITITKYKKKFSESNQVKKLSQIVQDFESSEGLGLEAAVHDELNKFRKRQQHQRSAYSMSNLSLAAISGQHIPFELQRLNSRREEDDDAKMTDDLKDLIGNLSDDSESDFALFQAKFEQQKYINPHLQLHTNRSNRLDFRMQHQLLDKLWIEQHDTDRSRIVTQNQVHL